MGTEKLDREHVVGNAKGSSYETKICTNASLQAIESHSCLGTRTGNHSSKRSA